MRTDLPPEAFTKDTLQEAFQWLQGQPEVVRNTVHTPERLVSLYRKAQRLENNDAPVSSKKFIDDLKNLATSLDQFQGSPVSAPQPAPAPVAPTMAPPMAQPMAPPVSQTMTPPMSAPMQTPIAQTETKKAEIRLTTETQSVFVPPSQGLSLDDVTMERVRDVKERFNLKNDEEALSILVSLGYEKFSQIP